jgi:hypothetical protein
MMLPEESRRVPLMVALDAWENAAVALKALSAMTSKVLLIIVVLPPK